MQTDEQLCAGTEQQDLFTVGRRRAQFSDVELCLVEHTDDEQSLCTELLRISTHKLVLATCEYFYRMMEQRHSDFNTTHEGKVLKVRLSKLQPRINVRSVSNFIDLLYITNAAMYTSDQHDVATRFAAAVNVSVSPKRKRDDQQQQQQQHTNDSEDPKRTIRIDHRHCPWPRCAIDAMLNLLGNSVDAYLDVYACAQFFANRLLARQLRWLILNGQWTSTNYSMLSDFFEDSDESMYFKYRARALLELDTDPAELRRQASLCLFHMSHEHRYLFDYCQACHSALPAQDTDSTRIRKQDAPLASEVCNVHSYEISHHRLLQEKQNEFPEPLQDEDESYDSQLDEGPGLRWKVYNAHIDQASLVLREDPMHYARQKYVLQCSNGFETICSHSCLSAASVNSEQQCQCDSNDAEEKQGEKEKLEPQQKRVRFEVVAKRTFNISFVQLHFNLSGRYARTVPLVSLRNGTPMQHWSLQLGCEIQTVIVQSASTSASARTLAVPGSSVPPSTHNNGGGTLIGSTQSSMAHRKTHVTLRFELKSRGIQSKVYRDTGNVPKTSFQRQHAPYRVHWADDIAYGLHILFFCKHAPGGSKYYSFRRMPGTHEERVHADDDQWLVRHGQETTLEGDAKHTFEFKFVNVPFYYDGDNKDVSSVHACFFLYDLPEPKQREISK